MKTFLRHLTLIVTVVAIATPITAAESLSVLLQKGIFAEETEGNVDAAIKIYEQVATEAAANHALGAQAQFRLAVCYQKKGNKEQAIKVLNEIVQSSVNDAGLAKKAREALVAMGEAPATAISVRRFPLPVSAGTLWSFSSDKHLLCYEPMASLGNLMICELATGKSWSLFKGIADQEEPANDALFSPDNQLIAFDVEGSLGAFKIYVAKADGSERRTLYTCDPKKEQLQLLSWSLDGNRVMVECTSGSGPTKQRTLAALDLKSGAKTEIARPTNPQPREAWSLSADGRYLARKTQEFPRKITLLELSSGREETIVDKDAVGVLGWTANRSKFVYSKNGPEGIDLWAVALEAGKPAGTPERIWANLGAGRDAGIGPDGDIYFTTRKNRQEPLELWIMEGVLANKVPVSTGTTELREEEIVGPNHSILDRKMGVGLKMPAAWSVRLAQVRPNTGGRMRFIEFKVPESDTVSTLMYLATDPWEAIGPDYALFNTGPKPVAPDEIDAWMRQWAQHRDAGVTQKNTNWQAVTLRPGGYAVRSLNGHRILSWSNHILPKSGDPQVEFLTMSLTDKVGALVWLRCPATKAEALRAAYDEMVASLQLP